MTCQDLVLDPRLRSALERARDLPSVPAVALEVLRLARDEDTNAGQLADVISLDPALTAKILKIVNSALMGRACEIATLKRACAQLGFKTIKLWALSFAMVDSLQRPRAPGFDHDDYWKRSVFRAVSAKLFAEAVKPQLADEAFLAGLLSQIGQLALATGLPEEYQALLAAGERSSWPSIAVQRETLGYSSDDFGVALLQSWGLPSLIHQAVLGAPDPTQIPPEAAPHAREISEILHVAAHCESLFVGPETPKALMDLYEAARKFFGMGKERVETLIAGLDRHTADIAEILHVSLGERLDAATVLREAQLQMLRETVVLLRDAIVSERRASQLEFENSLLMLKAQTDPLTGLAHRNTFQETLDASSLRLAGGVCPSRVGLLMIDIDGFKAVNDTYGHLVGDQVLQSVARVLRTYTREDDLPARYGGDEFAVVMLRTTLDGLKGAAERLRTEVAKQRIHTEKGPISVTVSIGGSHVAMFETPVSPNELLRSADHCLYAAKQAGRNRCEILAPQFKAPEPVETEAS
jgi:diguanylate cyclase (GGDEF)-like protein